MPYRVLVPRREKKRIRRIPKKDYDAIMEAISDLGNAPRPHGFRPLRGRDGYRIRIGDFRVLYKVDDSAKEVRILRIGDRKDVYD